MCKYTINNKVIEENLKASTAEYVSYGLVLMGNLENPKEKKVMSRRPGAYATMWMFKLGHEVYGQLDGHYLERRLAGKMCVLLTNRER